MPHEASVRDASGWLGRLGFSQVRARRVAWTLVALFLLAEAFFLINIQFPRGHNFDEFHYVPSAKQWLALAENQNWEHPPLGKLLMSAGIALFGDIPLGWRFMSTVFGALTLLGMYAWALAMFGSEATALWVALLTLFNHLLYVQARIGMLDTFMFGFMVWALAAFTATWKPGLQPRVLRRLLLACGVCLGLATATKWFAVTAWAACLVLVGTVRLLQSWKTRFESPTEEDWYQPGLWEGVRWRDLALTLGVAPVVAYFATFIPYFIQNPRLEFLDLFRMQARMYEGQLRVVGSHPYMSNWMDWPLLKRPIWYAFDKEGPHQEFVRGVLLMGNPIVMWSGALALVGCVWSWLEHRSRDAFLILAFYAAFYLSWALIPRKVSFYYYYYPAGMVLSLALAHIFHHGERGGVFAKGRWARWVFLGASFLVFAYFFPILAALRIPAELFRKWMWFRSWI